MRTLFIFWIVWIIVSVSAAAITWDKRKSFKDQAETLLAIFIGGAVLTACVMLSHRNEPDF